MEKDFIFLFKKTLRFYQIVLLQFHNFHDLKIEQKFINKSHIANKTKTVRPIFKTVHNLSYSNKA